MAEVIPLNAWRGQLDQGEKGVKRNLTNLMLHLRNLQGLGRELRFNQLTMQAEWQSAPLSEESIIDIRLMIEREGFQPVAQDVRPAIMRAAHENSYHPVSDYLSSLAWDGVNRLDTWMQKTMGAANIAFNRCIGPKVLIAAVARAFDPGCQVDTMLVLEGPQGIRKSSAVQALFGKGHTFEIVSGFDDHRKLANSIIGAWAVELAEFVSVTRSASGAVKGLITMRRDRVQLPYGRSLSDLPRQFVFVGTINPGSTGYLDDETGNRRYWPVPISKADTDLITDMRDQLWAEAVARYRSGERWWLEGDETALAETEQKKRGADDPWDDVLRDKLSGQHHVTPREAQSMLGITNDRMDKRAQMRIAGSLKRLGFARTEPKDQERRTYTLWIRDD